MLTVSQRGNYEKLTKYLIKANQKVKNLDLGKYGAAGVAALASATPVDTGLTASSWTYEIEKKAGSIAIVFLNTNIQNGIPIAIILQMGHGTGTGGYVQGRDYINPAIRPIFDDIAEKAWKEVTEV